MHAPRPYTPEQYLIYAQRQSLGRDVCPQELEALLGSPEAEQLKSFGYRRLVEVGKRVVEERGELQPTDWLHALRGPQTPVMPEPQPSAPTRRPGDRAIQDRELHRRISQLSRPEPYL